jgi:SAM-dependent methyltransferase
MISRALNKLKRDGFLSLIAAIPNYLMNSKKRKVYKQMLARQDIAHRFSEIYANNLWSSAESLSGTGSEVAYTEPLRNWLITRLPSLNVTRFVDAPCGDFNWMKHVLPSLDVDYLGLDIVESVINRNRSLYSSKTVNFEVANICEDRIPSCDLIMVRDCLFHLSYEDIAKFLKNLDRTDYKYLLTTTHVVEPGFKNTNIITGDFRLIDLFQAPFNFDPNIIEERVNDYPKGYTVKREMVLIKKKNLPADLSAF